MYGFKYNIMVIIVCYIIVWNYSEYDYCIMLRVLYYLIKKNYGKMIDKIFCIKWKIY